MTRWTLVAVVLGLGCGLGCGKSEDPGPSCEKVTDHVFEISTKAFPGHGDMGMGNRKDYVASCETRKMPASERRCLLAAQDMMSLARCRKIPDGAKPPAKQPQPAKPPEPKPATP